MKLDRDTQSRVAATEKAIRKSGSNAQRFVNAGHKLVHRGCGEFRCVLCERIANSDSDITGLDERCPEKAPRGRGRW